MAKNQDVEALQKQLQLAGQNWLPVTGTVDENTRKAISAVNKAQGFTLNGKATSAATKDTMKFLSDPKYNAFKTGNVANAGEQPAQTSPVTTNTGTDVAPNRGSYGLLSAGDFQRAYLDKATSGINTAANEKLNAIANNLATIMSSLDAEKVSAGEINKKALQGISDNEFATKSTQRELMNQAGWNPDNSGLAVGEMTRIGMGADKSRADANNSLASTLMDVSRRASLAQQTSGNDKAVIDQWKVDSLSGVGADALLQGANYGMNLYNSDLAQFNTDRSFNWNDKRAKIGDQQWNTTFDYQKGRDVVGDEQWDKTFASNEAHKAWEMNRTEKMDNFNMQESNRQYQLELAKFAEQKYQARKSSSGSAGSGGSGGSGTAKESSTKSELNNQDISTLWIGMSTSTNPMKWADYQLQSGGISRGTYNELINWYDDWLSTQNKKKTYEKDDEATRRKDDEATRR